MKILKFLCITAFAVAFANCSSSDTPDAGGGNSGGSDDDDQVINPPSSWLIPISDVKDGGPGKDGIPSIDNPIFLETSMVDFLSDDDLVVGVKQGDVIKAYPHFILDWHEVVNDVIGPRNVSLSYCPLTGTAFAWGSVAGNSFSTFGVSGLLYNANLILYDRATNSNWSQILQQCVNGELIGDIPNKLTVIETNWKTWKDSFPNSLVLTAETGFDKPYGTYPYGAYRTEQNFFLFVPEPQNPALPNKQRVFAITDATQSKVYKFSDFNNGRAIKDTFATNDYLVVGNENIITAFKMNSAQSNVSFTYAFQDGETFFEDDEGNKYNMFGETIEGPRMGQKLNTAESVTSMWFAVAAFFPNPAIYSE